VLAELLQAAAASVERQLAAARDEAAAGQAEAAAARRELARQAESFRSARAAACLGVGPAVESLLPSLLATE
jgi:septal ring factor EnvC (AmiA/AmiB activator)